MRTSHTAQVCVPALLVAFFIGSTGNAQKNGRFENLRNLRISTFFVEANVKLSADALSLYFFSDRDGGLGGRRAGADIWVARRPDTESAFEEPVHLDPPVNTVDDDWVGSISPDELTLFFDSNRPEGSQGRNDIWIAIRDHVEDPFDDVENVVDLNTEHAEGGAVMSPDGTFVVFHSDRPGGPGGRDLYVARRENPEDGDYSFGPATPLDGVNSELNDMNASFSSDGSVLFFRSNRRGGEGGFDLWMSCRSGIGMDFGPPVNLGPVINSAEDDFGASVSADWPATGSKIFYGSRRPGPHGTSADIWEATWVQDVVFRRADTNDDGNVDLSDAVHTLNWLFLGGKEPGCVAAANANGDGGIDLSDPVWVLSHLFLGGEAPVEPYPECGTGMLPTDPVTCDSPPAACQP